MNSSVIIPDRKSLPYGGAHSVTSLYLRENVKKYLTSAVVTEALHDLDIQNLFVQSYLNWIKSTKNNSLLGFEDFAFAVFSNGTTEGFDKFYLKNSMRRFRCFKGEYMYHQAAWRNFFPDWRYIEDDNLTKNDAVVISLPFSDTGGEHLFMHKILEECVELNIPVLIDCAYFGICNKINFDFTYPCITDITFSLSKALPVANLRIGMRLTRQDDDDSLFVMNKTNYTNRLAASVGLEIINDYSPDYIYNTYNFAQKNLCKQLGVEPSKCVIFGIDKNNKFSEYNRGTLTNRINLAKYLESNKLPNN